MGWLRPETTLGVAPLPDVVGAATPFFFLFIALELGVAAARGRKVYNLRQTINNLSAGTLTVLLGLFLKSLHVFPYAALAARACLVSPSPAHAWWQHAACFLLCDMFFYWFHRACHLSNLGWAAHSVHHSSPDFNLSTALRQGAGETAFSWLFYLPLALFCPLRIYALHRGINTVYQFFTHSELVGKLWWPVELVMNTPSHHRVHHARNYGRRNYAGVLIVWDRAFGTFEEEDEARPCIYGLDGRARPLGTYDPLYHQLHHLVCTLRLAATQGPVLAALFTRLPGKGMVMPSVTDAEPPGEQEQQAAAAAGVAAGGAAAATPPAANGSAHAAEPAQQNGRAAAAGGEAAAAPAAAAKAQPSLPSGSSGAGPFPWEPRPLGLLDYYAAAQFFGAAIPGSLWVLEGVRALSPAVVTAGAAWSALTVACLGRLLDGTPAAVRCELLRLAAQLLGAGAALRLGLVPAGGVFALMVWAVVGVSAVSAGVLLWQLATMHAGAAAKHKKAA